MSKLGCVCGHVIRDQTDNIPYKARFIRDQDDEAHADYIEVVNAFIEAIKNNKREQWIINYFSRVYPTDLSDASIIADIISGYDINFQGYLYQCENCGRIKVQVQDTNQFASFAPEDEHFKDVFRRFKDYLVLLYTFCSSPSTFGATHGIHLANAVAYKRRTPGCW